MSPKLTPIDQAIFVMVTEGILDDTRVIAHNWGANVARLQNAGLIARQPNGAYVPKSATLRPDGSSALTPPKPPRPPALKYIQVRVPQQWIDKLSAMGAEQGTDKSAVARDILGPVLEGKAYRAGKYGQAARSTDAPPSDAVPLHRRRVG